MEIMNKQEQMEELGYNKNRLQNELIETENQILLWERKTQLARETIAAVDTEVNYRGFRLIAIIGEKSV